MQDGKNPHPPKRFVAIDIVGISFDILIASGILCVAAVIVAMALRLVIVVVTL